MLRDLIARYYQQANQVRLLAAEIVAQLDASAIPAKDMPEQLCQALIALQNSYAAVRSRAAELLDAGELPPQSAPVTAYQSAVEESRWMQRAATLEHFGKVRTTHGRYEEVLTKAQAQANALLLQPDTLTEDAVAPYAAFLQALALGSALDDDTPEANAVLDELERHEAYFDSRLMAGLCRGAFVLAGNDAPPQENAESTDNSAAAPAKEAESAETPVATSVETALPEIVHATETTQAEEAATSEAAPEEVDPAAEEPAQNENQASNVASEQEEEMVSVCKPITQHGVPSVNKLRDRISSKMEIAVIEALGVMHVVTPELMLSVRSNIFGHRADIAASVLETMENRGFLCSYEVDGERLYCCAPMLSACMNKNDRYQLLNERVHDAKQNPRREWRKQVLQRPVLVARNELPLSTLRYYRKQAEMLSALFQCDARIKVTWDRDACCYLLSIIGSESRLMKVLPVEEFLAVPPEDNQPLLATDRALPAAELMAACPAGRRYFMTDSCYVWDGTAWTLLEEKDELLLTLSRTCPQRLLLIRLPARKMLRFMPTPLLSRLLIRQLPKRRQTMCRRP